MSGRAILLDAARRLSACGLNRGTSGNLSIRDGEGFLITPSGMDVEAMTAGSMVGMHLDGKILTEGKPSSEWRFHRDIYQARPEVRAVVHTHSVFATTLSCLRRDIPPFHYMIAVAGGDTVRCAPYALFGTQALSDHALLALQDRRACLLANHGLIAVGVDIRQAMDIAQEVETLCEQYLLALRVGEPCLLKSQEMAEVHEQFKGYGKWASSD